MNILITSAGRRVSLVRAFQQEIVKLIPGGKVFTVDHNPELSPACRISDGFFTVPKVTDPMYCRDIMNICKANDIYLLIPTIDTELIILAENLSLFKNNGVIPVISSVDIISMCRDKRKTHAFFDTIGLPRAKEIDFKNCSFPVFSKPFDGSSSIGVNIINTESQLLEIASQRSNMMFLEYLDPKEYKEFTIDLFFDRNHRLKCVVPRERIEVRTGEVSKSVTRRNKLYDFICEKFRFSPGFIGCITLQVFKSKYTDDVYAIEINPRFGGGYPLSYLAKANFPEMIIKEYLLNQDLPFFMDWVDNLLMLRYDDEILVYDYQG